MVLDQGRESLETDHSLFCTIISMYHSIDIIPSGFPSLIPLSHYSWSESKSSGFKFQTETIHWPNRNIIRLKGQRRKSKRFPRGDGVSRDILGFILIYHLKVNTVV